jgi:hypothetical protein
MALLREELGVSGVALDHPVDQGFESLAAHSPGF